MYYKPARPVCQQKILEWVGSTSSVQDFILFFFRNNHMAIWILTHVKTFDLVFLTLLDILVCEKWFLAQQTYLLISPHSQTIVSFILDFFFQLFNMRFQIIFIVFTFSFVIQKYSSFFIEFWNQIILDFQLIRQKRDEILSQLL